MKRRSKPLLIAPLIPLLALIGVLGIEKFHGTRYLADFVVCWCGANGLFVIYVVRKMREAKRTRSDW
jgi:hypothetical protein